LPKTLLARFIALAGLKGAEGIARVFYCSIVDYRIVMLHSFVKKSQDTPLKELEVARTRLLAVKRVNV
jgi:phage-related protein